MGMVALTRMTSCPHHSANPLWPCTQPHPPTTHLHVVVAGEAYQARCSTWASHLLIHFWLGVQPALT